MKLWQSYWKSHWKIIIFREEDDTYILLYFSFSARGKEGWVELMESIKCVWEILMSSASIFPFWNQGEKTRPLIGRLSEKQAVSLPIGVIAYQWDAFLSKRVALRKLAR